MICIPLARWGNRPGIDISLHSDILFLLSQSIFIQNTYFIVFGLNWLGFELKASTLITTQLTGDSTQSMWKWNLKNSKKKN